MVDLFTPLKIRDIEIRNRIVLPPMATEKSTKDGHTTEELYRHYEELATGPGMIIVEHSYVDPRGKLSPNQLGIFADTHTDGLKELAERISSGGAVPVIQISHGGGKCSPDVTGKRAEAPSDFHFTDAQVISGSRKNELKDAFVKAAERAMKAGFQGVEVHGAHGFLLGQFISPVTNRGEERYGLEERMGFPLEVVEGVKKVVKDRLLLYRLGASDMMEGGLTTEESGRFARELEKLGVDILDVSGNLCGSRPDTREQGYFIPLAEEMKGYVKVPVIGVGGVKEPGFADSVVREGRIDLVAVGREQWGNPKWAVNARDILKKE